MTDPDEAARTAILVRMAASRQELRRVLDPPRNDSEGRASASNEDSGDFPRSRTMRMLMNGRGLGTLGAVAAGLLMARPALALRLLRMLPVSALAKTLLMRGFIALRQKHE
jgi:hypothetical protein